MSIVSIKCPVCGGQVKIRDEWDEGYCIYCGHRIYNIISAPLRDLPSGIDASAPVKADGVFVKISDALSDIYLLQRTGIKKAKLDMLSEVDIGSADDEESKSKYSAQLRNICSSIGALPYEMTLKAWSEMKRAASGIYDGCAICTMYPEFTDTFMVSVDKMHDLTKMKWRSAFRKFGMYRTSMMEILTIRNKTLIAKRWLKAPGPPSENV